jgi:hypothetical protein
VAYTFFGESSEARPGSGIDPVNPPTVTHLVVRFDFG